MVAGRFRLCVSRNQRRMQLVRPLQPRSENRRTQSMHRAAAGVQHQQTLRRKYLGVKLPKAWAKVRPGW